MKLKTLLLVSFSASLLFLVSCKKDDTTTGGDPIAAKTILNVSYGTDPLQKMDIYLPANRSVTSTKVIIMVHGGGWIQGDKSDFTTMVDTLKKRLPGYAIFNINYRLAAWPANIFPTQELDVKAATEFIYGNRSTYLVGDKFVMLGASAGGHLSLLQAYKYSSPVKVKAVVDFFGPTDMVAMYNDAPASQPAYMLLLSGTPASNPTMYSQSSPVNYITASTCPTIIIQGGADPLVNATTQSVALKNKLTTASVVNEYVFYPAGGHGDWDAATYTDAFNKIQAFLTVNVP